MFCAGDNTIEHPRSQLRLLTGDDTRPGEQSAAGKLNQRWFAYSAIGLGALVFGVSTYALATNDYNKTPLTIASDAFFHTSGILLGLSAGSAGGYLLEENQEFKIASLSLAGVGLTTGAVSAILSSLSDENTGGERAFKLFVAAGALALAGLSFKILHDELSHVDVSVQIQTFLIAVPF